MTSRTRLCLFAALATLLGASSLGAAYDSLAWVLPVAGAVLLVAGIGELCRRFAVPVLLTPLLTVVAVFGYLTAVFASDTAIGGVLPDAAAVRSLSAEVSQGFSDMRLLAAPVPTNTGMVLITVAGVAAVALLVDLLAVTLRRAALAGLPLLALFAVPSAVVPNGVGWLPFVLSAGGFLALLLAEGRDRLGRWGRPLGLGRAVTAVTPDAEEHAETSPLAAVGRRIGAAAVGVALFLPALVPGLSGGVFGGSGGGLPTGNGSNSVTTFNPIVALKGYLERRTPKELMRVTTSDRDPGYIRMAALDRYNGTTWSESSLSGGKRSRIADGMPAPAGLDNKLTPSARVRTTIKVDNLDVHWLPTPYPPTTAKAKGDWRYDAATQTIFSSRASTRKLKITVFSRKVAPDPEMLRQAAVPDESLSPFVELPTNISESVQTLVDTITRNKPTAYDKAVAIQNYFRTSFSYDVSVPRGNSNRDLDNFIQFKRGYCEQFAAAMAIFARIEGIPARVSIGFTRGERRKDGSWSVTTADAHAWPELYFAGAGWLPFEPTPLGGQGRAVTPTYSVVGPTGTVSDPGAANGSGAAGAASRNNKLDALTQRDTIDECPSRKYTVERICVRPTGPALDANIGKNRSSRLGWLLAGLMVLALLLAAPSTGRRIVRRRRWATARTPAAAAHAAWSELRDDARDFGRGWSRAASPRRAGAALVGAAGLTGPAATAVGRLVALEERARYARSDGGLPLDDAVLDELAKAVAAVRAALAAAAGRRRRWRARLFPSSALTRVRVVAAGLADVLDAVDRTGARLRSLVLRSRPVG